MHKSVLALAATAVLVMGASSNASAADIQRRTAVPVKAPLYMVPYSWTGLYVGINGGYGWMKSDVGNNRGFIGGGQIGYNWQAGNLVYGLETDFQGTGIRGDVGNAAFAGTLRNPWFGTVRGRLGYAFDRSLLYVTGGAAYGKQSFDGIVAGPIAVSNSSTYWAGVVGGGLEQALWDRWSAKFEYLHVFKPDNSPLPVGGVSSHQDIVRVGLNYHF